MFSLTYLLLVLIFKAWHKYDFAETLLRYEHFMRLVILALKKA